MCPSWHIPDYITTVLAMSMWVFHSYDKLDRICRDLDSSDPEHRLSSLEDSNRVSQLWGWVSNLDLFGSNLVIWDILAGEAPVLLTYCECLQIASGGIQPLWTLLKPAGLFKGPTKSVLEDFSVFPLGILHLGHQLKGS